MMKKRLLQTFLTICIISSVASCTQSTGNKMKLNRIDQIWEMSDSNLNEAAILCENMRDSINDANEYVKNRYDLLCIRLRSQSYIIPSSDDSIKQVVEFFEKNGSTEDRINSYFYMGMTYDDLKDSPRAVIVLMKAAELLRKEYKNDVLHHKVFVNLASLYSKQLNYKEALKIEMEEYEYAEKNGKTSIGNIISIADYYLKLRDTTNCIKYLEKDFSIVRKEHVNRFNISVICHLLHNFVIVGKRYEAHELALMLRNADENIHPKNYDIAMGRYYTKFVSPDSGAVYFHHRLANTHNMVSICDNAAELMQYYRNKGDYKKAAEYGEIFRWSNDSVIAERSFELTRNARAEFLYKRDMEEEARIMAESARTKFWAAVCTAMALLAVMCVITFYIYRKKRIVEMEHSIKAAKEKIKEKDRQNSDLMRYALVEKATVSAKEVIDRFMMAESGKLLLEEKDWKQLFAVIDDIYPDFNTSLRDNIKSLTIPILHTAYLMKAGMSNNQIEHIMSAPHQTVWNRVKRIKTLMGEEIELQNTAGRT